MSGLTTALFIAYLFALGGLHFRRGRFGFRARDRQENLQSIRRKAIYSIADEIDKSPELNSVIELLSTKHKELLLPQSTKHNLPLMILNVIVIASAVFIITIIEFPSLLIVVPGNQYLAVSWLFPLFFISMMFGYLAIYYELRYWVKMVQYRDDFASNWREGRLMVIKNSN